MGDPPALGVLDDAGRDAGRRTPRVRPRSWPTRTTTRSSAAPTAAGVPRRDLRPGTSALADLPELRARRRRHARAGRARPRASRCPASPRRSSRAVLEHCFADPAVRRVVVEPDVRNDGDPAPRTRAAGFRRAARGRRCPARPRMLSRLHRASAHVSGRSRHRSAPHLTPALMARAHRHLVAKAIAEFSPRAADRAGPRCRRGRVGGRSTAGLDVLLHARGVHPLEHWVVDPASIARRRRAGDLDAQEFVVELAPAARDPGPAAADVPRGDRLAPWPPPPGSCGTAGYRGRAGRRGLPGDRGGDDRGPPGVRRQQRPDRLRPRRLRGVRPRGGRAGAAALAGRSTRRHPADAGTWPDEEEPVRRRAGAGDPRRGSPPGCAASGSTRPTTCYLPVHPWQWVNKLAVTFAPDVARRDLVLLGAGRRRAPAAAVDPDLLQPQPAGAALREDGAGDPEHGVPARALARLHGRHAGDQRLGAPTSSPPTRRCAACGFTVLRERRGDRLHRRRLPPATPARRRTARWSPRSGARARCRGSAGGERLATMASLLHRDADGDALVTALVAASGSTAATWVRSYLRAYLRPLVHCLLRPRPRVHAARGEPGAGAARPRAGAGADEGHRRGGGGDGRPAAARRRWSGSGATVPDDVKALAIHTDVFDGLLRYLGRDPRRRTACSAETSSGAGAATHRGARAPTTPSWPTRPTRYDLLRPDVPAQLPQPAAAAQHAADGGPDRPGRVADLRRHPGQPGRRASRCARSTRPPTPRCCTAGSPRTAPPSGG